MHIKKLLTSKIGAGTKNKKTFLLSAVFALAIVIGFGFLDIPEVVAEGPGVIQKYAINYPLVGVLTAVSFLLPAAATIFTWVVDPANMNAVINNGVIYAAWGLVRDTLNIAFILVLLFSAFCIVFQVTKFNSKQILLTLVIMALLVNFSFPISRFIIDAANSMMYYFLNGLDFGVQHQGDVLAHFADKSNLAGIIDADANSDTSFLIAAIIFTFIFAITLVIIAVLLIIRIVALAILIIFSPVAFTGSVIPSLSSQAGKWWDNLFKYAFFGPVMVFMLYIAAQMMNYMQAYKANFDSIAAGQTTPGFAKIVSAMAFYSIPIVILWIGIAVAQTMSIYGAGVVTGQGKKFMGWAGRNLGGVRPLASWGFKKTGVPGGMKQKWSQFKESGILGSERTAQREATIAGTWPYKVKGAEEKDMQRRKDEYKKNHMPKSELLSRANKGDSAAALLLAENGDIDATSYAAAMNNKNKNIRDAIERKTREKRADVIIDHNIKTSGATSLAAQTAIAEQELNKLNPDKWKEQDIDKLLDPLSSTYDAKDTAARNVYGNFNTKNKDKVTDNMQGSKYAAGKYNPRTGKGVWI